MSAALEKPASTGLHREEHGPRHSPELNPEVRLHADLEPAQGKLVPVRTQARLRDAANACMPGWSTGLRTAWALPISGSLRRTRGLRPHRAGSIG